MNTCIYIYTYHMYGKNEQASERREGGEAPHMCCSMLQCVEVRCSVLQRVAVHCSALQRVAVHVAVCIGEARNSGCIM